ncbi:sarcosine oxidase subunit gamma [Pararhizobium capsulatum DSM 1112]|uniref:Sarcosine oxidase subunit gamma n=1 Tax=Pararhizobium capsulatum DSM 1112 TaxID=1121113 RepID=A0ABU0BUS8_9HYPH|nr:sarcosine oxidase subunit gamma family protein [Pararhizobium capsulatum]MDQ0321426.1 sarcosine oxidase subunit gamma [Pararhizobium capsulatum DSM 1112]
MPFLSRHPLESKVDSGSSIRAVDHLEIPRSVEIVTVLSRQTDNATVIAGFAPAGDLVMRNVAPGEWLVLSHTDLPDSLQRRLAGLLTDIADVVDQSEGRVLLRLSGPNARRILAKGVAIDLDPSAFAVGQSANLRCGHVAVNFARSGENEFELVVFRSFTESLFEDLLVMGREFDLSYGFSSGLADPV